MRAALLLVATLLSACYETPRPDCAFECGPEGACPEGYSCREDGWCVLEDAPEEAECGPPLTDGEDDDVDAGQPDAEP